MKDKKKNIKKKKYELNYNLQQIKDKKEIQGITLITLVITVIVMLILAGVGISMITGTDNFFQKVDYSAMLTTYSQYKEELELYNISKLLTDMEYSRDTLNAGKSDLSYNTKDESQDGNIKTINSYIFFL